MRLFTLKNIQFDTILQNFQSYIQSIGGSMNKTSVFGQLITAITGAIHNVMLYIEDAMVEQNKYTAQRKKSIYALAAHSGYQPSYGRSAGAWVRLNHIPHNETTNSVIIRNHERLVCSQNGLYYSVILGGGSKVIDMTNQYVDDHIYITQGTFERQRFVSKGGPLYTQNFKFMGQIDIQYLRVAVNGQTWDVEESLYDMDSNETAYYIKYNPVGGVDICFGNGVHGRVLEQGDVIEIEYLNHDGENGNLNASSTTVFVFQDGIMDIQGNEVDGNAIFVIQLVDNHAVTSGSNPESISTVREMIGFNSRSLVLADSNNFRQFLSRYSFVGYNRTWSDPQTLSIKSLVMRNYRAGMKGGADYFDLTDKDFYLTEIQKHSIKNSLIHQGALIAGCDYDIIDMELAKYALFIYIKLKDNSTNSQLISNEIRTKVGDFFSNLGSDRYIPKSDIIRIVQSITDVDGVDCYFLSKDNEDAKKRGTYSENGFTYKYTETDHIGLDDYGNIVTSDNKFPVLMGGWSWQDGDTYYNTEPINIYFV